jgi:sulfite exporter TauE/SafE
VQVPAILAIVAGVFLIYQGLRTAKVLPPIASLWKRQTRLAKPPCLAASFFASFLNSPSSKGVFLAGLLTGFLPCGLVYAFLTLAASTANVFIGAATMAVFGAGTAPIMMLAGIGGSMLSIGWRQRLLQIAAWCVVAAGMISIARGLGYVSWGSEPPAGCPFCATITWGLGS